MSNNVRLCNPKWIISELETWNFTPKILKRFLIFLKKTFWKRKKLKNKTFLCFFYNVTIFTILHFLCFIQKQKTWILNAAIALIIYRKDWAHLQCKIYHLKKRFSVKKWLESCWVSKISCIYWIYLHTLHKKK